MDKYNHKKIDKKWQKKWFEDGIYRTKDKSNKPKYYVLDMFPYPSGVGLHVGHPKGFIATDIISRYKRMSGFNVLHPMGWDAFGLPAENYAIKNKIHPAEAIKKNIQTYKKQLGLLGFDYDWEREINTTDPEYYKWTQWIFLQLFKKGLAYESYEPINWCPSCKTGLANEDLEGNFCERCGSEIEKKPLRQWVLRITDYAERLLKDLEKLDWPESIKELQRNWIGKSEGAEITFELVGDGGEEKIKVFTTRADTLAGATYLVLAPEHKLIEKIKGNLKNKKEVEEYIKKVSKLKEMERTAEGRKKTGVCLEGIEAVNPLNKQKIPVFIADYVLADYGFGAVMAVPAHDERDLEFAKQFKLPIKSVIKNSQAPIKSFLMGGGDITDQELLALGIEIKRKDKDGDREIIIPKKSLSSYEKLIKEKLSPGFWNEYIAEDVVFLFKNKEGKIERLILSGRTEEEINKLVAKFLNKRLDEVSIYKLLIENDWYKNLFIHQEEGILINSGKLNGLNSKQAKKEIIKVTRGQKKISYKLRDWVFSRQRYWGEPIPIVHCQNCGVVAVPEEELPLKLPKVKSYQPTGTGESPLADIKSWVETKCPNCGGLAKRESNTMPQWAGSSWYYLRYIDPKNNKNLIDKKKDKYWSPVDMYIGGTEHATRHLVYARFWHKFLYDIGIVNYDEPFSKIGRSLGLILGEDGRKMSKRWGNVINPDDVVALYGADTVRLYEMFMGPFEAEISWSTKNMIGTRRFLDKVFRLKKKVSDIEIENNLEKKLHQTIKKVTEDIEKLDFNTAVSALMILINDLDKLDRIPIKVYEIFLCLLAPFAPHLTEESWSFIGKKGSIHLQKWPQYSVSKAKEEDIKYPIQINGKTRAFISLHYDIKEGEALKKAKDNEIIKKWLKNKVILKVIFVPNRIVNIVTLD